MLELQVSPVAVFIHLTSIVPVGLTAEGMEIDEPAQMLAPATGVTGVVNTIGDPTELAVKVTDVPLDMLAVIVEEPAKLYVAPDQSDVVRAEALACPPKSNTTYAKDAININPAHVLSFCLSFIYLG